MKHSTRQLRAARWAGLLGSSLALAGGVQAGMVTDRHGNVGYSSAAECDAAVAAGTARFYQPMTHQAARQRAGEARITTLPLRELSTVGAAVAGQYGYEASGYVRGACDLGMQVQRGHENVTPELVGQWVPFSPEMSIHAYFDAQDRLVRVSMGLSDNAFARAVPRPAGGAPMRVMLAPVVQAPTEPAQQCFANVLVPARFEPRTEQVLAVPATRRQEVVPATYRSVTEQVLVSPELRRQVAVPATLRNVTENVVVRPASLRDEPQPTTFTTHTEPVLTRAAETRPEIVPATYRKVPDRIVLTPERTETHVIPATYTQVAERVLDRPASVRVETTPASYTTQTERVLVRPETLRYDPVTLPLRRRTETHEIRPAGTRRVVSYPVLATVTEPRVTKEASPRLVPVPAEYDTVTERIEVTPAVREWRRGRAWVGQALDVRPVRGFVVDPGGRVDGHRVALRAASGGPSLGVVDTGFTPADNQQLEDDVWCLVDVPAEYQQITRQVLRRPAEVRAAPGAAETKPISRQVLAQPSIERELPVPAETQTITRQEVDVERLRADGWRLDAAGDLVATPQGEPVLRAAVVALGASAPPTQGAQSGREAYVRAIKLPAQYQTVTRYVIDQPAQVRLIDVPASYKTVYRRQLAAPERTETITLAATYKTVERLVVDQPESTRPVTLAAEHQHVTRRSVASPATLRQVAVPAVTQPMTHQVLDQPASVREEVVPAVYRTETRQVIDQPAGTRWIDVPAQYETLTRWVKVAEASEQRREVLCETNAAPAKIMEIQRALQRAGYDGPVDGRLGEPTLMALSRFQQARGLPVDGYLNLDTVRALGIAPN